MFGNWYLVEKLKGVWRNMIMSLFFLLLEFPVCKEIPVFGLLLYAYMKLSYGVKEKDDAILSETHYEGMFLHKYVNMKHNPILVSFTYSTLLNEYVISFHIWYVQLCKNGCVSHRMIEIGFFQHGRKINSCITDDCIDRVT